jgi:putative transposase
MSELRKANTDFPYFITMTVVGWIDVFNRREYIEILINSLKYCQKEKGLKIFAYSIMSSHIHIIAQQEEAKLNEILRDFKSYTAKEIVKCISNTVYESRKEWMLYLFRHFAKSTKQNKEFMFWQKTNHPTELSTPEIFDQKVEYIHNNPVEAGIVDQPENYIYSSAYLFSEIKLDEY